MTNKEIAEKFTILRVPVGSNLLGLAQPGHDDTDEMGVCIEPIESVIGFSEFEQYIYRTAAEREGKHDAPSQAGDLDLTIYSLRKFIRLAVQGNPQLVQTLFVPFNMWVKGDARGAQLQELAPAIVSRKAGYRYLGYLESQRQRLMGERGQKKVNRPELEAKFGFDTKYAMHIIRLGFQGVELLSTGKLTLPMPEEERKYAYAVRCGEIPLDEVLTKVGLLERQIKDLIAESPVRESPDLGRIEEWMSYVYLHNWKANKPIQG